ncbi:MAG: GerMN domain-containing protein [Actinomycetes bacterium]
MTGIGADRTSGRALTGRALTVVVLTLLAGCGIPTDSEPRALDTADIPYDLLAPATPTADEAPSAPSAVTGPRLFFVTSRDEIKPVEASLPVGPPRETLVGLMERLAAGPAPDQRADGLNTAIPPGIDLRVGSLRGRQVVIDLAGEASGPAGDQSIVAVAQIVLTATSQPAVDSVVLTREGRPIEATLADGELTSAPLTAGDFLSLVQAAGP